MRSTLDSHQDTPWGHHTPFPSRAVLGATETEVVDPGTPGPAQCRPVRSCCRLPANRRRLTINRRRLSLTAVVHPVLCGGRKERSHSQRATLFTPNAPSSPSTAGVPSEARHNPCPKARDSQVPGGRQASAMRLSPPFLPTAAPWQPVADRDAGLLVNAVVDELLVCGGCPHKVAVHPEAARVVVEHPLWMPLQPHPELTLIWGIHPGVIKPLHQTTCIVAQGVQPWGQCADPLVVVAVDRELCRVLRAQAPEFLPEPTCKRRVWQHRDGVPVVIVVVVVDVPHL